MSHNFVTYVKTSTHVNAYNGNHRRYGALAVPVTTKKTFDLSTARAPYLLYYHYRTS